MSSGEDPSRELWGQVMGAGEVEENDLGPPPTLGLELEYFLETPTTMWGTRDRQGSPPQPSINNYELWLEWQACQVDMPNWWKELAAIPNMGDPKRLAWKIYATFNVPWVICKTLRDHREYTVPPAPKCIQWGMSCWTPPPTCLIILYIIFCKWIVFTWCF